MGAKCDHLKLEVRTRVRAHLNLDVRGAWVRPKKGSQLTPCILGICSKVKLFQKPSCHIWEKIMTLKIFGYYDALNIYGALNLNFRILGI